MFSLIKAIKRVQKHYKIDSNQELKELLNMAMSTLRDNLAKAKEEENNPQRVHTNSFYGKLIKLCEKDNLNPNWVFFGKFPIYNDDTKEDIKIVYQEDLKTYEDRGTVALKYYKNMTDIVVFKDDFEYIVVPSDIVSSGDIKAIKFPHNYMVPNIKKDTVLFVDQNNTKIEYNSVYLVEYQNNISVNRVELSGDIVLLKNDNQKYKTTTAKANEVKIIGLIVGGI